MTEPKIIIKRHMLKIKLFKDEELVLVEFETYEQALEWETLQLEEFKTTNKVIDENKDRSYTRYRDEIQILVDSTCPKCVIEDHEGIFCRCEGRNIQVAKRRRARHKGAASEYEFGTEERYDKGSWDNILC
jgi:hypothetical protein